MTDLTTPTNLLLAHLQAEALALSQFHDTLLAEQKALTGNNVEALAELSKIKLRHVETLDRLAADRMRQLTALGITADENGMEQWLAAAGSAGQKAWKDLLAAAKEANLCNQTNGRLIQQSLQHHQQALAILMGAANQVKLYGADGQPQGTYSSTGASRGIIGTA